MQIQVQQLLLKLPDESMPILLEEMKQLEPREDHAQLLQQYLKTKPTIDVIGAIGRIGPLAKVAVPDLKLLVNSKDRPVRLGSMRALGLIGSSAQEAIPDLIAAFKDEPEIQKEAARALSFMGSAAVPALVEGLKNDNATVRAVAAQSLENIGWPARSSAPALLAVSKDPQQEQGVRDAADRALKALENARPPSSILIADKHSVKKGEKVTFTYAWGDPFTRRFVDAPRPDLGGNASIDGNSKKTIALQSADGRMVTAHQFTLTPKELGDYVVVVTTTNDKWGGQDMYLEDRATMVLHVESEKGWDGYVGGRLNTWSLGLRPLTRPYGLVPGDVIQVEPSVGFNTSKPLTNHRVEVQRYNAIPPAKLPPPEHILRVVMTDRNGAASCPLPDPGWWSITIQLDKPGADWWNKLYDANYTPVPVRMRTTMWVFVDEKP